MGPVPLLQQTQSLLPKGRSGGGRAWEGLTSIMSHGQVYEILIFVVLSLRIVLLTSRGPIQKEAKREEDKTRQDKDSKHRQKLDRRERGENEGMEGGKGSKKSSNEMCCWWW